VRTWKQSKENHGTLVITCYVGQDDEILIYR